jgi:hypothetical protein
MYIRHANIRIRIIRSRPIINGEAIVKPAANITRSRVVPPVNTIL